MKQWLLVIASALALLGMTTASAQEEDTRYVAKTASVALLQAPSPEASILMRLTPGEQVQVLGEQAGFLNVQTVSGMSGWLPTGQVSREVPAEQRLITADARVEELQGQVANLQRQLRNAQAAARQASQRLDNSQASAEDEVTRLQGELEAAGEEIARLRAENATLQADIAELELAEETRRMLAETGTEGKSSVAGLRENWPWLLLGGLGLLLAGLLLGYLWKASRVRARFHGLEI